MAGPSTANTVYPHDELGLIYVSGGTVRQRLIAIVPKEIPAFGLLEPNLVANKRPSWCHVGHVKCGKYCMCHSDMSSFT